MKLRKPKATKAKIKNKKGKMEEVLRPTSYHEVSIPDQYIKKAGWSAGDELAIQVTSHQGDNILIIRNIDKQSLTMDFFTGTKLSGTSLYRLGAMRRYYPLLTPLLLNYTYLITLFQP